MINYCIGDNGLQYDGPLTLLVISLINAHENEKTVQERLATLTKLLWEMCDESNYEENGRELLEQIMTQQHQNAEELQEEIDRLNAVYAIHEKQTDEDNETLIKATLEQSNGALEYDILYYNFCEDAGEFIDTDKYAA